jgi:TonB family protein
VPDGRFGPARKGLSARGALSLLLVLAAGNAPALDWFGDIAAHRLVVKLSPGGENSTPIPAPEFEHTSYLVLEGGVPYLSPTRELPEDRSTLQSGTLDIVLLPAGRPPSGSAADQEQWFSGAGAQRYLEFRFSHSGWAADTYETTVRIPFTVDPADSVAMLRIADRATVEVRWRDPKGGKGAKVSVVTYWSGLGAPTELPCEVLESTLGFRSRPVGMGWPRLKGNDTATGTPTPLLPGEPAAGALHRIQVEFKELPRPLASVSEAQPTRSTAVLNEAAQRFVASHSRRELITALYPFFDDEEASGDAALLVSALPMVEGERTAREQMTRQIQDSGYESPARKGAWDTSLAVAFKARARAMDLRPRSVKRSEAGSQEVAATLEDWITTVLEDCERVPRQETDFGFRYMVLQVRSLEDLLASGAPPVVGARLAAFVDAHSDAASLAALSSRVGLGGGEIGVARIAVILGLAVEQEYWPLLLGRRWPPGVPAADGTAFERRFEKECSRLILEAIAEEAAEPGGGGPTSAARRRERNPLQVAAEGPPPAWKPLRQSPFRYKAEGLTTELKRISGPDPVYTDAARQAGVSGSVVLDVVITAEGKVAEVRVIKGLPLGLSEAAVAAVEQWRYEPARIRITGDAVPVVFFLTVPFDLGEGGASRGSQP